MRAVDREGVQWDVSRRWLEIPRWRIGRPNLGDVAGVDWGTDLDLPGIALWIALTLLLFVLLLVGLPLLGIAAAVLAGVGGLVFRIAFRRSWLVRATSGTRELSRRVRGTLGSRRAIHEVADAIERGDHVFEPRGAVPLGGFYEIGPLRGVVRAEDPPQPSDERTEHKEASRWQRRHPIWTSGSFSGCEPW